MKTLLALILFLFFCTNIYCQESSDKEKYLEIRKSIERNPENALLEITEFQNNAKTENSVALSSLLFGQYYFSTGKIDLADSCFHHSHNLFKKENDTKGLINANSSLASIAYVKGEFHKAIDVFLENIEFMKSEGDTLNVANLHNNVGAVFLQLENYSKSEVYYKLALQGYRNIKDTNGIGLTLRKLGSINFNQYKFELANKFYKQAMEVFSSSKDSIGIANTLLKLGDIQFEWRNDKKSAILLYKKSESIFYTLNNPCNALFATEAIGDCYFEIGEYNNAKKQFLNVLELVNKCEYNYKLPDILERLAQVEEKSGNYKQAFEYQGQSHMLNDSIYQSNHSSLVEELETKYQSSEKDKTILQNDLILKTKNEKLSKQAFWMWIIGTSVFILLLIISLFFYFNRKQARLNAKLTELNQFKSQLLTIIGHDLRSPIAQIITSKDNVEQKATTALEILDNLLVWGDLNNTESGNDEKAIPFELILDELEEEFRDLLQDKQLKLNVQLDQNDLFKMKRNELEVVLRNILSNAIKYSPEKTVIFIRNNQTTFSVENKFDSSIQSGSQIGLSIIDSLSSKNGFSFTFEKKETAIAKITIC